MRAQSAPTLRANKLHGGAHIGLLVRAGGRGTYLENEVWGNKLTGLHCHKGARVKLGANHVHDNLGRGVFIEGAPPNPTRNPNQATPRAT